jgi:hypothetical protein
VLPVRSKSSVSAAALSGIGRHPVETHAMARKPDRARNQGRAILAHGIACLTTFHLRPIVATTPPKKLTEYSDSPEPIVIGVPKAMSFCHDNSKAQART